MESKPRYSSPRAFIESYPPNLQSELAHLIFFFSNSLIGWQESSCKDYWEKYSVYNKQTTAYHFKSKLTSAPFRLNKFVIVAIQYSAEDWCRESVLLAYS
jgi:hypothetical protein